MILRRSRTAVAVDLCSRHIRLVAIERDGSKPRLTVFEREPIEPESVVAGEIMDFHRVAEALRRVFGSAAHATIPRTEQLGQVIGPLFRSALRSAEVQRPLAPRARTGPPSPGADVGD